MNAVADVGFCEGRVASFVEMLFYARFQRIELARPSWRYLRDVGVDFGATEHACGGAFMAHVVATAPMSFDFDPSGGEAIVIEALDESNRCVDLVSWRPSAPHRWRRMFGTAPALGMAAAANPTTYIEGLPLQLFRTPLEWLQSACDGAVLLDRRQGARWLLDLDGFVDALAPRDDAHAAEIQADRLAIVQRQCLVVPVSAPALVPEPIP